MATISVNTNYGTGVTLVANDESVTVDSNAILTVDGDSLNNGFKPGYFICNKSGEIRIVNSSTTTPNIIDLWDQHADFLLQKAGVLTIAGDWITVHTGTGAASQTINFASIGGKSIDSPGFIEVETSSGSNIYKRWAIFFKGTGGSYEHSLTDYGIGELGNISEFDIGTQIMTFGDGTNGNVIPSGAKVRFPNIHITSSGAYQASYTSGNRVWLTNGGTFIADTVSFSRKWSGSFNQAGKIDMRNMGWSRYLYAYDCPGSIKFDNVCFNPDSHNFSNAGLYLQYCEGKVEMDRVSTYSSVTGIGNHILSVPNTAKTFDDIQCFHKGRTSAASNAIDWDNCGVEEIKNLLVVGARCLFSNMSRFQVETVRYSDQPTGVKSISVSLTPFSFENVKDCVIRDMEYSTNGCPPYGGLWILDANCNNINIHNFTFDNDNHCAYMIDPRGGRHTLANGSYTNDRVSYNLNVASKMGTLIVRNFVGTKADTTQYISQGGFFENYEATSLNNALTNKFATHPFHVLQGSTNGWLSIGQFGNGYGDYPDLFTAAAGTVWGTDIRSDDGGVLYFESAGVEAVFKNRYPIRSITAFGATAPVKSEGATAGRTYNFRMKEAGSQAINWTIWRDATLAVSYQDALADMTTYDSNIGFDMEFKIETTTALGTHYLRYIKPYATVDAAWSPSPIYSDVTITGVIENAWCYVEDITTPLSPIKYPPIQADVNGEAVISIPHPANGTDLPIRIRVRHYDASIPQSWVPFESTLSLPPFGVTVPVTLVKNNDITGVGVYNRGDGLQHGFVVIDAPNKRYRFLNYEIRLENLFDIATEFEASYEGIQYEKSINFTGADGILFNGWRIMRDDIAHTDAAIDGYLNVDGMLGASPDDETNGSVDIQAKVVRTIDGVTQADVTAIKAVTDKLSDMITGLSPDYQFDAKALENTPLLETVRVIPVMPEIVHISNTFAFTFGFLLYDENGHPIISADLLPGTVGIFRKAEGAAGATTFVSSDPCVVSYGKISYDLVVDPNIYSEGDVIGLLFSLQFATSGGVTSSFTGGVIPSIWYTTVQKITSSSNVTSVLGTPLASINDFKADTSLLGTLAGQATTQADIAGLNDFDYLTQGVTIDATSEDSIVDKTWDEVLAGHITPGSTGKALDDSASAVGIPNVNVISVDGTLVTGPNDLKADLTGIATTANQVAIEGLITALNDFDPTIQLVNLGSVNGISVTRPDDLKADVSILATSATQTVILGQIVSLNNFDPTSTSISIGSVNFVPVTDVTDFQGVGGGLTGLTGPESAALFNAEAKSIESALWSAKAAKESEIANNKLK
ncbi:hypothetical protein N9933_01155 [bacterium]|nr:hypothetical protein [bacterium]